MPANLTISLDRTSPEDAAAAGRNALMSGGIIAFPTETVYGLAIRGDDQSVHDQLFRLKGRSESQRLATYVTSPETVSKRGYPVGLRARKLMRAFWPGPLTLVLENGAGETMGFRCSAHPVAALLANDDNLTVLGTSANHSGEAPMEDMATIMAAFGEEIALGIDNVEPLSNRASTVVSVPRPCGFEVLREGELATEILVAELKLKICFVCTGNTCRSPLAEVMFRNMVDSLKVTTTHQVQYEIISAGTGAAYGAPASANSYAVARERGLELGHHTSQPISAPLLADCDLIVTMTGAHRDLLVSVLPECEDRVRTLGGKDDDLADPYGGDMATYKACAQDLERHLDSLLEDL